MPLPTPASTSTAEGFAAPALAARWASVRKALRPWATPKVIFAAAVLTLLVVAALFAPWVAPFDPQKQDLMAALTPPQYLSGPHVFGADHVGRDVFSRVIYGARVSLLIAFVVVVISGLIGMTFGLISGFFGGWADFAIQKFLEVFWAFPPLLLAIAILAFLGQGLGVLILALAIQRWIPYCRVARANTLSLKERDFVQAARSIGVGTPRIILKHILPNLVQSALIIGTFAMASAIIAEASLSFLGLGVPPSIPTWGAMLADGRTYISTSWWMALFPGLAIFLTVLSINMLGDALRDNLDPRLKRSGRR